MRTALILLALTLAGCSSSFQTMKATLRLEVEDGELNGLVVRAAKQPFSGKGYVTGLDTDGDAVTLRFRADPGVYVMTVGYRSHFDQKGYDVDINGHRTQGMLPMVKDFARHTIGKFNLNAENIVVLNKGWGFYDLDYVEFTPVSVIDVKKPRATLVDPQATAAAKRVHAYLCTQFGDKTLTGQFGFEDIDYVRKTTGKLPALAGFDFMDYSPSRVERHKKNPDLTAKIIEHVRSKGGILTISWHWNAPSGLIDTKEKEWWRGFRTDATTFDVEAALAKPTSKEHKLLIRDMDAIATQLKKLADADIPVLWRPLHEANGRWFWWGAKGPDAFKALWTIMYKRFTNHHKLHNLIWVYSPAMSNKPMQKNWYPGDSMVDIVAADIYFEKTDNLSTPWEALHKAHGGRKLIALGECGVPPDPKLMDLFNVRWSSFALWPGFPQKVPVEDLKAAYAHQDNLTLDELPPDLRR